jgi:hypothetical protein
MYLFSKLKELNHIFLNHYLENNKNFLGYTYYDSIFKNLEFEIKQNIYCDIVFSEIWDKNKLVYVNDYRFYKKNFSNLNTQEYLKKYLDKHQKNINQNLINTNKEI